MLKGRPSTSPIQTTGQILLPVARDKFFLNPIIVNLVHCYKYGGLNTCLHLISS